MLERLLDSPTDVEARAGTGAMSHEVLGTRWVLTDTSRNFLCNAARAACPSYASAELLWYLSREQSVAMLLPYAPSYKRFAEEDGRAYGSYGHRLRMNISPIPVYAAPGEGVGVRSYRDRDMLDYAVNRLKRDRGTRQCVVSLWRPDDLITEDKKDVPCTVAWQFFVRQNNLHMLAYMRSNDVWLGTPYDVYTFTCIQRMIADELGCGVGSYYHHVGSLHLYARDFTRATRAIDSRDTTLSHAWESCPIRRARDAVAIEAALRTKTHDGSRIEHLRGCLADSVACCGRKLGLSTVVKSPALARGLENVDHRRAGSRGKDDAGEAASD